MSGRQHRRRMSRAVEVASAVALVLAVGAVPASAQGGSAPAIPKTYVSALTPQQIQALSQNQTQQVIVLFKDQHPEAAQPGSSRAGLLATDQAPISSELHQLGAPKVHGYSFVNAIAATMSSAEVSRLQQDPSVLAVVPDNQVEAAPSAPVIAPVPLTVSSGTATSAADSATSNGVSGTPAQACSTDPNNPGLEPEALQSMNVDFGKGGPAAAHSLANGAGVKVAVFPDGLDPNIPDFRTAGGTGPSAIFDYEDFSGEGTGGVTGGEEAFGDASSIISQGNQVFNLAGEVNPALPTPAAPCYIKIEGVAPGASLAVMKVFGNTNYAFNSEILQGIDWAVRVDHVDILSESFGGNPVPNPGTDPIAMADQDAVAAGITVVVSSGDAGSTNTIGTPAVDPGVISAGATTDYRLYEQTTSYGIQEDGNAGWLSDQISGLSSSGLTEEDQTIDILAPGEAGWADCSTNTAVFTECADVYQGSSPQPIVAFGGTSESAPLTAGAAALVIQAYRSTHFGATPSPAVVKQILMSTASDLDSRASDQGPGLIDAYRAVQAAMSYQLPKKTGDALLYAPNAISLTGPAGTSRTTTVTVTNDGAISQTVTPSVRALGPATTIASGNPTLNQATDPTFVYQTGALVGDVHPVTFTVPSGTDRLAASIGWQQSAAENPTLQTIRFDLFDPEGRLVLQSRPQGPAGFAAGGFSQDEVHDAQPGTWEMLIFDTAFAGPDSYSGPLSYSITSQSFVTLPHAVSPASKTLAPGASASFAVTATTPATPGDSSESLVFGPAPSGDPARATVAITLRSLAQVGQPFSATMTGGNSRMSFYGQELPYVFDVARNHQDIDVNISVSTLGYQVLAFLVDPTGTPVDVQSSLLWDGSGTNGQTISLFRHNPMPGRWSLLIVQENDIESVSTSTSLTASLSYDQVQASASGLPNSPGKKILNGKSVTAQIQVTNTGAQPEAYMIDARRDQQTVQPLTALFASPASEPLPITNGGLIPQFVVPPFSPAMAMAATSTVPITLDTSPNFGTPDVEAFSFGDSAVAFPTAGELPASIWSCAPAERGPFTTTAVSTTYSCGAYAITDAFASDVSTTAGNLWADLELGTSTYVGLVLNPGQSGTILVTISPTDPARTHVRGFLSLETFNFNTLSSDEVASFPYAYTVG
jgi:hypothetical protein